MRSLLQSAATLLLLTGCDAQTIIRLDRELADVKGSVNAVQFSPDGKQILSGGFDGVYVWDSPTGRLLRNFSQRIDSMVVLPERRVLLGGLSGLDLWNYETGEWIKAFPGHEGPVYAIDVSPDARRAISGTGFKVVGIPGAVVPGECLIRLWDIASGRELKRFEGHAGAIVALAFLPDGEHFLSVSGDTTMRLWSTETGKEERRDGVPKEPNIWVRNNKQVIVLDNPPKESLDVTSDGRLALRSQTLWDLVAWKPIGTFGEELRMPLACTRFSPDDSRVLSAHDDATIRLWDVATRREVAHANASRNGAVIYAIAFSPDGRFAASGGNGLIGGFIALKRKVRPDDTTVRLWTLPNSH